MKTRSVRAKGVTIVTRDGKPVQRFDATAHRAWQKKVFGGRTVSWVEEFLFTDRNARC